MGGYRTHCAGPAIALDAALLWTAATAAVRFDSPVSIGIAVGLPALQGLKSIDRIGCGELRRPIPSQSVSGLFPLNDSAIDVLNQLDTAGEFDYLFVNRKTKQPYPRMNTRG